jgi:plasmid stabilization system protein ParE
MTGKSLRWSKRALEDNRKLTNYLLNEWGLEITLRVKNR